MYRKIVWCYVFVLTLLDISLNTKLSAQGKSHGVTVHDSLIEGITFQEWGKESGAEGAGRGGRAVAAGALALSPPALEFGRAALAAAHALTVTLTNTANTTMHLASVAGTTPDFHASFFESKTLPPQANTSFSVVYLGRREGPVSAHLYIHTSLGVHKYPVSAVGVASEWGVWPLVGVRVPLNATVEPLLTMHNPTDQTIQVTEVYSSGAWLGLVLPGGGESAPRGVWTVPPRATRPLVRLRMQPPAPQPAPLTAYIRIKANITGGGLVVCVEARSVPAGEYVSPLQLRLRTRGSRDPPDVFDILAGNSAAAGVALDAGVWAARCAAAPPAPDPPSHNGDGNKGTANGNGVKSEGVHVTLLHAHLEPHQELTRTAQLTLDYAALWAGYVGGGRGGGAWCAGWLRVGGAALPYSVRLLPGTLRLTPSALHFVTANRDDSLRMREVRVRNEFPVPVHIARVDLGPDVDKYFEVESLAPLLVGADGSAVAARVRLRDLTDATLSSALTLRTNLTDYSLPLLLYSGRLHVEWDWPNSADGELRLGVVGTSSTRRVAARLHNPAPAALCVRDVALELPGASLALEPCAHLRAPPPQHACRCIPGGAAVRCVLTVVAPARAGQLRGALSLRAQAADAPGAGTRRAVSLDARAGRVAALPLQLARAAPYAWAAAPLVLESSMALRMRVLRVALPAGERALRWEAPSGGAELAAGRHAVGTVLYAPERLCEPDCYTGLDVTSAEGAAWVRRAAAPSDASLRADAALQAARHAVYAAATPRNVSLHVHTTHAVQLGARGAVAAWWPRLAPARAAAGLAPVAGAGALQLRARNPSASHALLLQPVLAAPLSDLAGSEPAGACAGCVWARGAFSLAEWRATRGAVSTWRDGNSSRHALPLLLLAPDAELELTLSFTPHTAAHLAAYLYLRNNLTIIEGVLVSGRGAYPSFELGGRRPGTNTPLLFEVSECGGTVRRTVVARNTGQVALLLRDWRLAGQPCQARGFRLTPCAPLALAPNESRALTLAFTPDYTLARVAAELSARTDTARAAFLLHAAAPARLLPRCRALAPRPPWEPAARAAATLLALAALALVLAAAALDAERELRRARAARPPPAARQPLDLRALAQQPPAPPAPAPRRPPARRRRTPRRDAPALDPQAERRAFERWRAEVLGRNDDDDERSSDDERRQPDPAPEPPSEAPEPRDDQPKATDGYEADPETEDRPQGSGDDDAASTGSGSASASSSSPTADDRDDDGDEPDAQPAHPHPSPPGDRSPPGAAQVHPAPDAPPRPVRARREPGDTPRRGERTRPADPADARTRPAPAKHHARKDKPSKRVRSRPAASPPRSPVPRACDARAGAAPGLRWGASWSSVVARGPLAPIGSDVRRRAEPEARLGGAGDHSLFYFNGDAAHAHSCHDADFTWRPPPPLERPAFTPARDFLALVHDDERRQPDPAPEPPSEAPEPRDDQPKATDGYEADPETEDRPQGSGDDDAASTGSGSASASSSSPTADDRDDDGDEPDAQPAHPHPSPPGDRSPPGAAQVHPAPDAPPRPVRARREPGDTPRRGERTRPADPADARTRPAPAKHHARKDKPSKRVRSRPAASPPRSPVPRACDARAGAAPGLRWGASWSSVVARGPLAPIGSDVRRRAEPEARLGGAGDHSLFYFNGDAAHAHSCHDADFTWRPPPPLERPAFTPARDFLDEPNAVGPVGAVGAVGPVGAPGAVGSGSFRSLQSVWSSTPEPRPAAAAWLWGGYSEPAPGPVGAVRPPPGFGAPPRPVRPYDPFRSLASIWAPGAQDWRSEAPEPAEPAD